MKVFFDTNVYVAEALLGGGAERMLTATLAARWRIVSSSYVLDEAERVLTEKLGFSGRFSKLTRDHIRRRAQLILPPASGHVVPHDPSDSPVLRGAVAAGADLLVTNDVHLLAIHPYRGLRIVSMSDYFDLLVNEGHIAP